MSLPAHRLRVPICVSSLAPSRPLVFVLTCAFALNALTERLAAAHDTPGFPDMWIMKARVGLAWLKTIHAPMNSGLKELMPSQP